MHRRTTSATHPPLHAMANRPEHNGAPVPSRAATKTTTSAL